MLHSVSPFTVLIAVFDGVETLGCTGAFDVFATAQDLRGEPHCLVATVAPRAELVRCHGGLGLVTDHSFTRAPRADLIVVPGGPGRLREATESAVVNWLRQRAAETPNMLSIGTGAYFLAEAGLLDGRRVALPTAAIPEFSRRHPAAKPTSDPAIVEDGPIASAAHADAGIEASLRLLGRLIGRDAAVWVRKNLGRGDFAG